MAYYTDAKFRKEFPDLNKKIETKADLSVLIEYSSTTGRKYTHHYITLPCSNCGTEEQKRKDNLQHIVKKYGTFLCADCRKKARNNNSEG